MGMHRWLLGPFVCLILAVTSARPPECEEAPLWSVGGQQPLVDSKGKASMLEAMLAHFHTYGMTDLRFMIVNSKIWHARSTIQELQERVSFDVYQETDEDEVWSVMGGGKDDMYVYDRCGRLTYYIPFPLSIMHEQQNIVSTAVLATYFRSPCGITCQKNTSLALDEFVEEIDQSQDEVNSTTVNNELFGITDMSPLPEEEELQDNLTSINMQELETTISNDTIPNSESSDDYEIPSNYFEVSNSTDADYSIYNDTAEYNATSEPSMRKAHDFFNNLVNMFFSEEEFQNVAGFKYDRTNGNNASTTSSETTANTESSLHNETHHQHQDKNSKRYSPARQSPTRNQQKTDRCAEAEFDICKDWSKKRLLHAQKCCSSSSRARLQLADQHTCRNFGKKRCKKIQSLLKCCLKTAIADATTTEALPTTTATVTTVDTRLVCCKRVENGKLCRIAEEPPCEEGEYIADSTNLTL